MTTRVQPYTPGDAQKIAGTLNASGEDQQHILIANSAGGIVDAITTAPVGTERGIVTRPIASGVQTVSHKDNAFAPQVIDMTAINNALVYDVAGYSTFSAFLVPGAGFSGSLIIEASVDGTNFYSVSGLTNGANRTTSIFSGIITRVQVAGWSHIRLRVWQSGQTGTATVTARLGTLPGTVIIGDPVSGKGVQAGAALQTQDVKDSGRVPVMIYVEAAAGVTTETLLSFIKVTGNTAGSAATSIVATSGKTLRLTDMMITMISTGTALVNTRLRMRYNSAGAAILTSAIQGMNNRIGFTSAPVAGSVVNPAVQDWIDGFEISGTAQFAMSQLGSATSYTLDISLFGFEY